ncbi:hypothetical protein [Hymenobacter crusticola]|uniref:Uncharacterized protein n=1 Tax=Hymenobacter crusticola TaxID=1770526 RepID=A0A243W4Z8_9BACT|nr:hypothetical protein [Hymenobacter crusticola]OUJ67750.1 hypothetical protein BXP70_28615 [Hymenobacter crusticola]
MIYDKNGSPFETGKKAVWASGDFIPSNLAWPLWRVTDSSGAETMIQSEGKASVIFLDEAKGKLFRVIKEPVLLNYHDDEYWRAVNSYIQKGHVVWLEQPRNNIIEIHIVRFSGGNDYVLDSIDPGAFLHATTKQPVEALLEWFESNVHKLS